MHGMNKYQEADSHISAAADLADRMGSKLYQFSILLAKALFAFDRQSRLRFGFPEKSFADRAEGGYFYTYISQPYAAARLCQKALDAGIEVEYVHEFIRRLKIVPEEPPLHLESWPWPLKIDTLGSFEL